MKKMLSSRLSMIILGAAMAVGAVLRYANLTPYLYYPDSYQNLLVARNLETFGSVLGTLGDHGMPYPPFPSWTRPLYPFFISVAGRLAGDLTAARMIAVYAGIMAIPAAYLAVRSLTRSLAAGLGAGIMLAVSFNHTVWSGSVMTETTGVLFILLTLWMAAPQEGLSRNRKILRAYLSGVFFGMAVLTRYEYAVLILPVGAYIFYEDPRPVPRLFTMLSSMALLLAAFGARFLPPVFILKALLRQSGHCFTRP